MKIKISFSEVIGRKVFGYLTNFVAAGKDTSDVTGHNSGTN